MASRVVPHREEREIRAPTALSRHNGSEVQRAFQTIYSTYNLEGPQLQPTMAALSDVSSVVIVDASAVEAQTLPATSTSIPVLGYPRVVGMPVAVDSLVDHLPENCCVQVCGGQASYHAKRVLIANRVSADVCTHYGDVLAYVFAIGVVADFLGASSVSAKDIEKCTTAGSLPGKYWVYTVLVLEITSAVIAVISVFHTVRASNGMFVCCSACERTSNSSVRCAHILLCLVIANLVISLALHSCVVQNVIERQVLPCSYCFEPLITTKDCGAIMDAVPHRVQGFSGGAGAFAAFSLWLSLRYFLLIPTAMNEAKKHKLALLWHWYHYNVAREATLRRSSQGTVPNESGPEGTSQLVMPALLQHTMDIGGLGAQAATSENTQEVGEEQRVITSQIVYSETAMQQPPREGHQRVDLRITPQTV